MSDLDFSDGSVSAVGDRARDSSAATVAASWTYFLPRRIDAAAATQQSSALMKKATWTEDITAPAMVCGNQCSPINVAFVCGLSATGSWGSFTIDDIGLYPRSAAKSDWVGGSDVR